MLVDGFGVKGLGVTLPKRKVFCVRGDWDLGISGTCGCSAWYVGARI